MICFLVHSPRHVWRLKNQNYTREILRETANEIVGCNVTRFRNACLLNLPRRKCDKKKCRYTVPLASVYSWRNEIHEDAKKKLELTNLLWRNVIEIKLNNIELPMRAVNEELRIATCWMLLVYCTMKIMLSKKLYLVSLIDLHFQRDNE